MTTPRVPGPTWTPSTALSSAMTSSPGGRRLSRRASRAARRRPGRPSDGRRGRPLEWSRRPLPARRAPARPTGRARGPLSGPVRTGGYVPFSTVSSGLTARAEPTSAAAAPIRPPRRRCSRSATQKYVVDAAALRSTVSATHRPPRRFALPGLRPAPRTRSPSPPFRRPRRSPDRARPAPPRRRHRRCPKRPGSGGRTRRRRIRPRRAAGRPGRTRPGRGREVVTVRAVAQRSGHVAGAVPTDVVGSSSADRLGSADAVDDDLQRNDHDVAALRRRWTQRRRRVGHHCHTGHGARVGHRHHSPGR